METLPAHYIWLIIGVGLLALEAFGLPGVGFLFAGLGALTVGLLLEMGLLAPAAYLWQITALFLFTACWTLLLWKPLQKFRLRVKQKPAYDNLIGALATVHGAPLQPGRQGQVAWSGTFLQAELAPSVKEEMPVGARVVIEEARGALVIVSPKR